MSKWSKLGPEAPWFGSFVLATLPLTFLKAFLLSGNNKTFQTYPNFFSSLSTWNQLSSVESSFLLVISETTVWELGVHVRIGGSEGQGQGCHPEGNRDRKVTCLYHYFQLNTPYLVASTYFSHSISHQWPLSLSLQLSPILPTPSCKGKGDGHRFIWPLIGTVPLPHPQKDAACNDLVFNCFLYCTFQGNGAGHMINFVFVSNLLSLICFHSDGNI